jgi:hypothetical protein
MIWLIVALCSVRKAPCSPEISLLQAKLTGKGKMGYSKRVKIIKYSGHTLKNKKERTGNFGFQNRQINTNIKSFFSPNQP